MSLLEGLDVQALTPAKLWAALDAGTRRLAVEAVYDGSAEAESARHELDAAIATTLRFRPVAVRRLPLDRRIGYALRAVRADDPLASTLLLALHLGKRRAILESFLDSLGISHRGGMIEADDFEVPEAERLTSCGAGLYDRFPADQVDLYLAALIAMEPETWGGLVPLLESRRN
jgi:hypothetical protein